MLLPGSVPTIKAMQEKWKRSKKDSPPPKKARTAYKKRERKRIFDSYKTESQPPIKDSVPPVKAELSVSEKNSQDDKRTESESAAAQGDVFHLQPPPIGCSRQPMNPLPLIQSTSDGQNKNLKPIDPSISISSPTIMPGIIEILPENQRPIFKETTPVLVQDEFSKDTTAAIQPTEPVFVVPGKVPLIEHPFLPTVQGPLAGNQKSIGRQGGRLGLLPIAPPLSLPKVMKEAIPKDRNPALPLFLPSNDNRNLLIIKTQQQPHSAPPQKNIKPSKAAPPWNMTTEVRLDLPFDLLVPWLELLKQNPQLTKTELFRHLLHVHLQNCSQCLPKQSEACRRRKKSTAASMATAVTTANSATQTKEMTEEATSASISVNETEMNNVGIPQVCVKEEVIEGIESESQSTPIGIYAAGEAQAANAVLKEETEEDEIVTSSSVARDENSMDGNEGEIDFQNKESMVKDGWEVCEEDMLEPSDEESEDEDFVDPNESVNVDPDFLPLNSDDEEITTIRINRTRRIGTRRTLSLPSTPTCEILCCFCNKKIPYRNIHVHALNEHPSCVCTLKIQPSLSLLKKRFETKDCVQSETLKKCLKCGRKFVYWSTLMKHTCSPSRKQASLAKCGKIKQYACDKCGKKFGLQSLFNVHQIVEHKMPVRKKQMSSRLLQKIDANKTFCQLYKSKYQPHLRFIIKVKNSWPSKQQGDRRLAAFHKKQFSCTCHVCSKRLRRNYIKCDHLYNLHGIRTKKLKYQCDVCPKGFYRESSLVEHSRTHKPAEMLCQVCALKFKTQDSLKAHVQRYHENKRYTCEQCNKPFKSKNALTTHIADIHKKDKPPTCPYEDCKKTFSNAYNLKVHIRKHTGEKPYACDRCAYTCVQKNSLNHHLLVSHGIQIRRKRQELNA